MLVRTWKDQIEKTVLGRKAEELDSDFRPVTDILHDPSQFLILAFASISLF